MTLMIGEDERLEVGPWWFTTHVEMRGQCRNMPSDPPIKQGDVWFRIVVEVGFDVSGGHDDLAGLAGELSTCWQYSLDDARREADRLVGMMVTWLEYDEPTNEYVVRSGSALLAQLVENAVGRFRLVAPEVAT